MKYYSFLAVPLLALAMQCAKESEENQFYKIEQLDEYRYDEHAVSKEAAMESWEDFLAVSQDLIVYSRTNLGSLQYQIDEADGSQKMELMRQYEQAKRDIEKLALERRQRNDAFHNELESYQQQSHTQNEKFIRQFKREMSRINVGLGCRIEDQPDNKGMSR